MFQGDQEQELPPHHGEQMSVEAFEELAKQATAVRYEYINGRAYAMSGGTANHSRLTGKMYRLLEEQLASGPCHAFFDMYVLIAQERSVLPDVVVTCDVADYRNNATLIRSPHLIVEALSPATERIDRTEKFEAYKSLPSLQEYVLIHQKQYKVEAYRKVNGWQPQYYGPGEEIELMSLDLTVSLDELYTASYSHCIAI
ncbi:Uma2 family endonuclease [Ktedonosporobacter rubrisoli]|nr:Uma2 family endonuclease [Ktedonosporobacter rubrisoli]